jgi:FKBP-type peptidyl-prolyl cis-trans isomerase (trigger factor)
MSSFKIISNKPVENEDCRQEIVISIDKKIVAEYREEAISNVGEGMKIDGFRPGHIPEKVIVEKFGEVLITEEAGRLALEKIYPDVITEAKVEAIGNPEVAINKIVPNETFEVKITTATHPEIKIADYKKIAKEINGKKADDTEATDKEIDEAIKELQNQVAHDDHHKKNPDDKGHDHGDLALPEVNEEFIKKFGDFKTVDEFKTKIKDSIKVQKVRKEQQKKRVEILDAVIGKSEIKMPKILVTNELHRIESEMTHQIGQMGLKVDDYLKHIGKTIEDLRKDWEPEGLKRAQTQVVLNEIANKESIKPEEEAVNKEVAIIMNQYKDTDKLRAMIFVETMLTNEKVWGWLEGVK